MKYTKVGYDMSVVGSSPAAARYAGIPSSAWCSGACCSPAVWADWLVASRWRAGRMLWTNGLALGSASSGIVVAALARYHPLGIIVVAVFLGGLRNAGAALQSMPGNGPR